LEFKIGSNVFSVVIKYLKSFFVKKAKIWLLQGKLISFLLITFILLPVFIFLFKIPFVFSQLESIFEFLSSTRWLEVLYLTILQAGLSTFLSVVLGVFGALGLFYFSHYKYKWLLELFCLLPALLPPLIVVLAWVNVSESFFSFNFSFYSVLLAHILMNIGLVSVFISRLMSYQSGLLSFWAYLNGFSRWFFLRILLVEWRKDIVLISLLVFSFCFTSFSVPLLVGGLSGQTLEVFIAEKLKNPATWPEAMILFFIETIFIFICFRWFYVYTTGSNSCLNYIKTWLLSYFPFSILPIFHALLIFTAFFDISLLIVPFFLDG